MGKFEEDLKNRVWARADEKPPETEEAEATHAEAEEMDLPELEFPDDDEEYGEERDEPYEPGEEPGSQTYEFFIGQRPGPHEVYEEPEPEPEPEEAKKPKKKGFKKRRRRKKINPLLLLLLFVLFMVGVVAFLNSSAFAIRKIEVDGNHYYTQSQVIDMSGIESGKNLIFELRTKAARNALLKSPYIRTAVIERVPPDTVKIVIEERLEYAAVIGGNKFLIIDVDGMVLRITDEQPEITVLEGIEVSEGIEGKPLKAKQTYIFTETLRLLAATDAEDMYFKKVYFSAAIVRTYLDDNYYCEGTPENILKNLSAIKELAEQHYAQNINKGVIKVGTDGYLSFSPRID